MTTLEQLKEANDLTELIAEDGFTITGTGRYRKTREHDSLVIDTKTQTYHWNSRGEHGDAITWLQNRRNLDFQEGVNLLARRVHLDPPCWSSEQAELFRARRQVEDILAVATDHFAHLLQTRETAFAYARGRGWTDGTIKEARLQRRRQGLIPAARSLQGSRSRP